MEIRSSSDRGHFELGWLDTYHTFSFGEYYDPAFMHFSVLRVMNEDRIGPSQGFALHGHANMEIVTYVIQGTLRHTDSLGHTSTIEPGKVQRMTAGSGIRHAEYNASDTEPLHLLQIWILPAKKNLPPSYEEKTFPGIRNYLRLIVSPEGEEGSLKIHQNAKVFATQLQGEKLSYTLPPSRVAWIQVIEGPLICNGASLQTGDGAAITEGGNLAFESTNAHFLLFDLPVL